MATAITPNMFETYADHAQTRLLNVLCGRGIPWPLTVEQRHLLEYLRQRQGRDRVMPLGELAERLHVTPRAIKELVQELRLNFRVPICSSRDAAAGGYFLAGTLAEVDESIAPMFGQAITMLRVCRAMRGSGHDVHELLGQIRLELEKEAAA